MAVLENIVDSTNIGAIFPLCGGARHRCDLAHAVLLRPAVPPRGARQHGNGVFRCRGHISAAPLLSGPKRGCKSSARRGFRSAAMALTDRSVSIDDENVMREPRLAIVLGTEGRRPASADHCAVRLYGAHPHVARRGLAQRRGGQRRGVLAAPREIAKSPRRFCVKCRGDSLFLRVSGISKLMLRSTGPLMPSTRPSQLYCQISRNHR